MKQKLLSRKFLLAVTGLVSVFLSEMFGLELSPEAIGGMAVVVIGYVFGEGMVDKRAVEASVKEMKLDALDTAAMYARSLELQLQSTMNAAMPPEAE